MTDPVTPNRGLVLPTVGGDSGTWGGIQNNGIFTPLDSILGATTSISITSADVTLTTTQFQNNLFVVSGTLTAPHNLILPFANNGTAANTAVCVAGNFIVQNNGTGNFNLFVKTATTGATAVVPQGYQALLYSDGANVSYATNGLPCFAAAVAGNPNGQLAGTAGSINTNVPIAFDYVNFLPYFCTASGTAGSAVWSQPNFSVTRGFDTAVNLSFTTSVAANVLTVTALAASGNTTPTVGNPIIIPFPDSTVANGDVVTVNVTGSFSISTFATGASLGAVSGSPFRFWIVAFNNGGAPVLGLVNCSGTSLIYAPDETGIASSTGMTSGATSAATFYTPNGVTVSSKAFRILGFLTYETPLVTAGTYNNPPDVVRLFGPGVKKPGDVLQTQEISTSAWQSSSATYNFVSAGGVPPVIASATLGFSAPDVIPRSKANIVRADALVTIGSNGAHNITAFLTNGTTNVVNAAIALSGQSAEIFSLSYRMVAATTGPLSFSVYYTGSNGAQFLNGLTAAATAVFGTGTMSVITVSEIMG